MVRAVVRALLELLPLLPLVAVRAYATPPPPLYQKVNGGQYIDGGEPLTMLSIASTPSAGKVQSLYNDSGDLLYFFRSELLGTVMGRLSNTKSWDFWSRSGWSHSPQSTPTAISHIHAVYPLMKIFTDPLVPRGLLGAMSVGIRLGGNSFDHHGFYSHFRFDGSTFRQWKEGSTYDEFYSRHLISDWSLKGMDFEFDGANLGVMVAFTESADAPAKRFAKFGIYAHADPHQPWSTFQDVFPSSTAVSYSSPRITKLGNSNEYLLTFRATGGGLSGTDLRAAILQIDLERGPTWRWWSTSGWQTGGTYAFAGVGNVSLGSQEQVWVTDGNLSLVTFDGYALRETVYNNFSRTFSTPLTISPGGENTKIFSLVKDALGTLWLITGDGTSVYVRKKFLGSTTWTTRELVYTGTSTTLPVGVNFVGPAHDPLIFITEEIANYKTRLAAISPASSFWNGEQPLSTAPPPNTTSLPPAGLSFVKGVTNWQPDLAYQNSLSQAGPIGVDRDGTVYATRYGLTSLIVGATTSVGPSNNRAWGNYWDHLRLPGGVAVNNARNEVYVTSSLAGDSGMSLGNFGQLQRWDVDMRSSNVGYWSAPFTPFPSGFDSIYRPYILPDGFSWPNDVAYNSVKNRVYVVNSLEHKVMMYTPTDDPTPFSKGGLFESSIDPSNLGSVRGLVSLLITQGMLKPTPTDASKLTWQTTNFRGDVVTFLMSQSLYWQLAPLGDHIDFLRNVNNHYKSRFGKLTNVGSIGSYGSGSGQFKFPTAVDTDALGNLYVLDGENHRVQKWTWSGNNLVFNKAWGTLGRGNGQFLYPVDLAVDQIAKRLYVTDSIQKRIQAFDLNGSYLFQWNSYTDTQGTQIKFDRMNGIGFDSSRGLLHIGANNNVISFCDTSAARSCRQKILSATLFAIQ